MAKQTIKCGVTTCKFQNNQKCTLEEIKVDNSEGKATKKNETACKSFECDDTSKTKEEWYALLF